VRSGDKWFAVDRGVFRDYPEQIEQPEKYPEGAQVQITVNAYERNPHARQKCIEHWGCRCMVCDFDFAAEFGSVGDGFIHVHHVVPLSEIREEYEVDPVEDLRPVCPNCHAMLHRSRPVLSIEDLCEIRKGGAPSKPSSSGSDSRGNV
jgi:5-methylcytosine-specific restriction protein A